MDMLVLLLGLFSASLTTLLFRKSCSSRAMYGAHLFLFFLWSLILTALGSSPVQNMGQILVFLSWGLLLFYIVAGAAYRVSFLGVFSGAAIGLMSVIAWCLGLNTDEGLTHGWVRDAHVILSLLAYAGFTLSALASIAFMVQNSLMKRKVLMGCFRKLPKINALGSVSWRLNVLSLFLLSLGMLSILSSYGQVSKVKLLIVGGVFVGYILLGGIYRWRGIPAKSFALINLVIYIGALTVLFLAK